MSEHIQYPFRLPEANVQAEVYHWARLLGGNCVLELGTIAGRVDAAFLCGASERLLCIVECKRERRKSAFSESKQVKRYSTLGVPVFCLTKRADAEHLVREIIADESLAGIPVSQVLRKRRPRRKRLA